MSLPWYYLERATRVKLVRLYYLTCFFTYPAFVALNYKSYVPDRAQILMGRSLQDEILNPRNIKQ